MEIRILYDNEAIEGYKRGWGFSCLVGEETLFDLGADFDTLIFNMRKASVNLEDIKKVFLSHEHGDHIGGTQVLGMLGDVELDIPCSFSSRLKTRLSAFSNVNLVEVDEALKISEGFYSTGELGRFIKEHSIILETDNGLTIITGCSHPGLDTILKAASKIGEIYGVIGGFHGFRKLEALKEVKLIAPCHCTVLKKEILDLYPTKSVRCSAGCSIEV